jgi:hypothetical protein
MFYLCSLQRYVCGAENKGLRMNSTSTKMKPPAHVHARSDAWRRLGAQSVLAQSNFRQLTSSLVADIPLTKLANFDGHPLLH